MKSQFEEQIFKDFVKAYLCDLLNQYLQLSQPEILLSLLPFKERPQCQLSFLSFSLRSLFRIFSLSVFIASLLN